MYKGGREIVLNKLLGTSDLLNDSIQYLRSDCLKIPGPADVRSDELLEYI